METKFLTTVGTQTMEFEKIESAVAWGIQECERQDLPRFHLTRMQSDTFAVTKRDPEKPTEAAA